MIPELHTSFLSMKRTQEEEDLCLVNQSPFGGGDPVTFTVKPNNAQLRHRVVTESILTLISG